jgi:hypothetical protein
MFFNLLFIATIHTFAEDGIAHFGKAPTGSVVAVRASLKKFKVVGHEKSPSFFLKSYLSQVYHCCKKFANVVQSLDMS